MIHLDFELVKSHRKKIDEADLTTFETNNYDVNTKSDRRPENALSTDVRASEEDGMHDEKWPSETLQSIIKRSCVRCAKNSSVNGSRKRAGIDTYKRKLFCSRYNASSVLVIDTETGKLRTISCDVEGKCKWDGIALCGSKMYCAPAYASSVLVIDCDSEKHTQ